MSRREELRRTLWSSEPRTLIKHQVYKHYLQCWMGVVLQAQGWSHVTVVDAFAGPGRYSTDTDGSPGPDGSPLVIAKTFLSHSLRHKFRNKLTVLCCEQRPDRVEHLRGELAALEADDRLDLVVLDPMTFDLATQPVIGQRAHSSQPDQPVLWILDPFNLDALPMKLVRACLRGRRDEVLVTWFSDDVYRFLHEADRTDNRDRYFGGPSWRSALTIQGEGQVKEALLQGYRDSIIATPVQTYADAFSLGSKNEAARYSLVFATHNEAGLRCFARVRWRLDPYAGQSLNEFKTGQLGLYDEEPDYSALKDSLARRAGSSAAFSELAREATVKGFTEAQLRAVLTGLRADGHAVRQSPLESRTPWPDTSLVRFY